MKRLTLILLCLAVAGPAITDEGRIPISSPVQIAAPGHYILTRDVTVTAGDDIRITSDGVNLDLNGMTIHGDPSVVGITIGNVEGTSDKGVVVRNGRITGTFVGIQAETPGGRLTIQNVTIRDTLNTGIIIGSAEEFTVEDCLIVNAETAITRAFAAVPGSGRLLRNVLLDSGTDGINVWAAANLEVAYNTVSDSGRDGVAVWGGHIHHNMIRGSGLTTPAAGLQVFGVGVRVHDNVVTKGTQDGMGAQNLAPRAFVHGNVFSGNGRDGIWASGDHILVENNQISGNGRYGIYGDNNVAWPVYRDNMLRGNGTAPIGELTPSGNLDDQGGNICDGPCP